MSGKQVEARAEGGSSRQEKVSSVGNRPQTGQNLGSKLTQKQLPGWKVGDLADEKTGRRSATTAPDSISGMTEIRKGFSPTVRELVGICNGVGSTKK